MDEKNAVDYEMKLHVAKSIRMLDYVGLLDMNGHVSLRVPGEETFLINSRKASRASVTVGHIVRCDLDGRLVAGEDEPPSEVHIHAAIYQARSDVSSVVHSHPHWQTVLGIAGIDVKPVFGIGAFVDHIETYELSSLINTPEMGAEIAQLLKESFAVHLRHHGSVVVGDNVESAFARSVFMEENAKKQYFASLLDANHWVLEGENLERTRRTTWSPSIVQKVWTYYEEKAGRVGALDQVATS
ncbi:class II aldolase/adducin family protein [Alicyclobacillus fastidiosus]|uniref:Class II aldolase/adducin family protein n=1 Tax=Alicyclobacillus fastidiosus TaxID=392011 RepID=A0ABV5ACN6_9BACL|nr:class II aldolase/adducin family protein [Alicyclobacillus fastidiosus]WEH11285.1 class II aldolase/adducin family protein [Alicyclobacillus fastidiosus]